jgi:hypothetical protein
MAKKENKIHYIYKTTCNVTGKYYVGMHSTNNLDDGYMGSGKRLRYSIRKYGVENHIKEILEYYQTREELSKREREIVNKELIKEYLCMNLIVGGEGGRGFTSEEQKLNAIKSNEKQKLLREDPEWVVRKANRMSVTNKQQYEEGKREKKYFHDWNGKNHSEESKQLMSENKKGTGIGETNSQYGTCWITKDGINKKIKKEDLETYLNEGWVKGRK